MKERTGEQTLVWQHMQRLAQAGLGTCDGTMELRDKLALYDTPRAALLTTSPSSNGFIRSSKDDLLVRRPSALLARELSGRLGGVFRENPEKGIVFAWSRLRRANIEVLFDTIMRVARTQVTSEEGGQPEGIGGARANQEEETLQDSVSTVMAGAAAVRRLGPYLLVNEIGRGAFGVVWRAERRGLVTTQFALKLPRHDEVDLKAVKAEAEVWVHASGHPNVLPIIEANIYDGQVVIASEYAPDGSLRRWLNRHGGQAPSIEAAADMAAGILAGLEHLHGRRIIHRDLKPDNVLLQGEVPRLADFGIARVLKTTNYTTASGTPYYMAPEAFDGKHSEQTDLWAAAVTLYQLLTGRLPFPQPDITSLLGAIIMKVPAPLPESIPAPLQEVILRALRKNASERFRSAFEMRQALRAAMLRPSAAGDDTIPAEDTLVRGDLKTTLVADREVDEKGSEEVETVLRGGGAVEFTGDDAAYLRWLERNPGGFVINTTRQRTPKYMVLHKATCGLIKSTNGVAEGGFTQRGYVKICATTVGALRDWVMKHGKPDGSFSQKCGTCKPLGDVR